ncbi:MAG TPA: glycoside hydrolase family 16 protein, partial [Gemmatimonadaceae bacterium]|nr:glycoside hydrolase family 16 protein [Gemmatimonadaceae bacterium]
ALVPRPSPPVPVRDRNLLIPLALVAIVPITLVDQGGTAFLRQPERAAARSAIERGASPGLRLVWHDEFDGPAGSPPDPARWRHELGDGCAIGNCGWGNGEKQRYTADPSNASLAGDGSLAITARAAPAGLSCYYGPCRYTSAKLTTKGTFEPTFGRVEARIRLPAGQGLWPAFWMLGSGFPVTPWPACGEIDIMEFRGSRPWEVSAALHGPGYASDRSPFVNRYGGTGWSFADDYHRYAVEWEPGQVRFYVDDALHYTVNRGAEQALGDWAFDRSFYLILNLAVGGGFDGDPRSEAIFPATMRVDYVRVFAR